MVLGTDNKIRLRIDDDGAISVGHNPGQSTGTNTQNAILTLKGYPNENESSAAILALIRGYNTTSATANHTLGRIVFGDKQAGEYAFIEGEVEANGAVGDTPGRLVFSTASDGSTTPTEKMRISNEGYVTKPAHPSFCVRFQNGDTYVSTNIFRLTSISNNNFTWNTGGHYSTSTGKFTAPVAGVYFFEAQALTDGHGNNDNIQDMMELHTTNGRVSYCRQRRSYFRTEDDANGYFVNSTSGQVNLAAGDEVWFQRRNGLTYGFRNYSYTYFTGWLIG